jgi:hypothetical protein
MSEITSRSERPRFPEAVRRRALQLKREDELTGREIRERLASELQVDVGLSTVAGWLAADARRKAPDVSDLAGEIRAQAAMLLEITGSEIRRLRAKNGATDVERIERLSRSLKVLEGLKAATPATEAKTGRAQTLEGLSTSSNGDGLS